MYIITKPNYNSFCTKFFQVVRPCRLELSALCLTHKGKPKGNKILTHENPELFSAENTDINKKIPVFQTNTGIFNGARGGT